MDTGNGASSKFKGASKKSPQPVSSKKSFKLENEELDARKKAAYGSVSMKFEKPPKMQVPLTKSQSLALNSPKKKTTPRSLPKSSPRSSERGESFIARPSPFGKQKSVSSNDSDDSLGGATYLLSQARSLIAENPSRALQFANRAAKGFENCSNGEPDLNLVMCLHVTASIRCRLGQYEEAVTVLKRAIDIPIVEEGMDHSLAKFSGYMQLGDTYAMLGQLEKSTHCYSKGLEVQKQALGENDSRVGDTCRYIAESYMRTLQFEDAEKICLRALQIHRDQGTVASLEETADRRLLGLICDSKGEHEVALEHFVLASMGMMPNCHEDEIAAVDCCIGDAYLKLTRYDEAVFAYQKALTVFRSTKGDNHATVASVIVRLASLYNKTGKLRESMSYCENALKIYEKPLPGTPSEEVANGFTEISAIYESMGEPQEAINLLKKALAIYDNCPGQLSTIAGIEAQMGILYYMTGDFIESYELFKSAIEKLRVCGDHHKPAHFGLVLNQMGLTCVEKNAIKEAAELFEEARDILEKELGPYHPDTLGVLSNLGGVYDALGRLDEAIKILEYLVWARMEKIGTSNPDVADEKRRLKVLLKETGRKTRHKRAKSLEELLEMDSQIKWKNSIIV